MAWSMAGSKAEVDYAAVEKHLYEVFEEGANYKMPSAAQPTASSTLIDDFLEAHPEPDAPIEPPPWHIAAQWVYWHRRMPKYRIEKKIWREAHTKQLAAPSKYKLSKWTYEAPTPTSPIGMAYTSGSTYWATPGPLNVYGEVLQKFHQIAPGNNNIQIPSVVADSLPIGFAGAWTEEV